LAGGIQQAAVLKRASYKDIFVYKHNADFLKDPYSTVTIATSSIRRKAQWLHKYPNHTFENLRGNVNTRLRKVEEQAWAGAIFAAAGLERINLRPLNSVDLDWMLPAPAQGAIMVVCRTQDETAFEACQPFNDPYTALCAKIERDFLKTLLGGCSTPISALASVENEHVVFRGNVCSTNGAELESIEAERPIAEAENLGLRAANDLIQRSSVQKILTGIRHAKN
jgi:hydroxymethylbilane synthase